MKPEEKLVDKYLKELYGDENVVYEPRGTSTTPDFSVKSSIAIEVRRLNQNIIEGKKEEGLEKLSYPLYYAFLEVLESLKDLYNGNSYIIDIDYKRPLSLDIEKIKVQMKLKLEESLKLNENDSSYVINILEFPKTPEIVLSISKLGYGNGKLFTAAGILDNDVGGNPINVYVKNIKLCIKYKSNKVKNYLPNYKEWWLYLVDYLAFGLSPIEISEVKKQVENNIGNFDKVIIFSYLGKDIKKFFEI